jgi:hypothetical protein
MGAHCVQPFVAAPLEMSLVSLGRNVPLFFICHQFVLLAGSSVRVEVLYVLKRTLESDRLAKGAYFIENKNIS